MTLNPHAVVLGHVPVFLPKESFDIGIHRQMILWKNIPREVSE